MKKLYILLVTICFSAFAKAHTEHTGQLETTCHEVEEVIATNWTGTYTTTFGEVILNQKGKSVVGTYRELGTIRSTKVQGNELHLRFDNGTKTGYAVLKKTNNGFTGSWSWDNKRNEGSWKGTKKGNASQGPLKGNWYTNFWGITFVHNKSNIVAGHYGNQGGKIWGEYNPNTRTLKGNYIRKPGAKKETFEMRFNGASFTGRYNNTALGSWTGSRKSTTVNTKAYLLKVTLNSYRLYETKIRTKDYKFAMNGEMKVNNRKVPSTNMDNKRDNKLWGGNYIKKNVVERPSRSNSLVFQIGQDLSQILDNNTFHLGVLFDFKFKGPFVKGPPGYDSRPIDLKETLKFLTEVTNASDYPLAPNRGGRRRFANCPDTFMLETIGGKRYIRGYGDYHYYDGDFKMGYHYTIELIDSI